MKDQVTALAVQSIVATLSSDWEIFYRGVTGHEIGNVVVLHRAETLYYSLELEGFLDQDINLPKLE